MGEKKYLAHISEDGMRQQLLLDHLQGTKELAGRYAGVFGYQDWGECCGLLHDIGKYSMRFQERLWGSSVKVDHSTAGAQVCNEKGGFYQAIGYCIAGHHAGLPDMGGSSDTDGSYKGRMKKKLEDYQDYQKEVTIPLLKTSLFSEKDSKTPGFTMSFFIRMLYSCLVDADYLDTECFMKNGEQERDAGETMPRLWEKLKQYVSGWLQNEEVNTVNGRRTEILKSCIEKGKEERGLFLLTVPTGGGKTIASMAFALQHAVRHDMKHIVYVIPYTSIIEQNARIFREILGEENVLEHHCGVEYEDTEELKSMQLATENWDKPVIVTTNVQFFESLFSNKASRCRKLHNLADSILIFDEAQMLPNDYLLPCTAAMEELLKHYKSSIVLCTATQPALQRFFPKDRKMQELCPRLKEQFSFFRRTSICNLGKISQELLQERLRGERQVLCILNTRKEAQLIYEQLRGEGVYHLSALMYPVHRRRVLKKIQGRLREEKRCIVIATSLVEAGVDLDFQAVYRQLAGVDSVIQAAGRCNREGRRSLTESNTWIFQLEEVRKVPGQEQQIDSAKLVLREREDISSLEAIEAYFQLLYDIRREALDKKQIMRQFEEGRFVFAKIAKQFKLIEQDTKMIFVTKEPEALALLMEMRQNGLTRRTMRKIGQYSVSVYQNMFDKLYSAGMLLPVSEDLKEEMFVLRDGDDYSEEKGLRIDAKLGDSVWI